MTYRRVSNGLVNGLYSRKARIEREAMAVIPQLLSRLEERLELSMFSKMISTFWPLPVYRPRVRVWPQEVVIDEQGISLSMGVTAAAVDAAHAPDTPRILKPVGSSLKQLPDGTSIRVGVAPNLLQPLSALLIDANVARINVLDIPEKKFAILADRQRLADAIPDLRRFGEDVEIRTELVLLQPLSISGALSSTTADTGSRQEPEPISSTPQPAQVVPAFQQEEATALEPLGFSAQPFDVTPIVKQPLGQPTERPHKFRFHVPQVLISIAIKEKKKSSRWKPYAGFEFDVSQSALAEVVGKQTEEPEVRIEWSGSPSIQATGHFDDTYEPNNNQLDVEKMRQLFADAWLGWTTDGPISQFTIPELALGDSNLKLSEAGWLGSYLIVGFTVPGVEIANLAGVPFEYEMKSTYSGWGGPFRLEPGKTHQFKIAHSVVYRRKLDEGYELYSLAPGSRSEYRVPNTGGKPALFQARQKVVQPASPDKPSGLSAVD